MGGLNVGESTVDTQYYRDLAALYRFYGGAFLYELTEEQIDLLAQMWADDGEAAQAAAPTGDAVQVGEGAAPETEAAPGTEAAPEAEDEAELGARWMRTYLARRGPDARRDLAVDYARVFLAAGVFEGDTAVPYESVYLSDEGILMQGPRDEVVACYRAAGFAVRGDLNVPEDHAGFELEFMALLCDRIAEALEADGADAGDAVPDGADAGDAVPDGPDSPVRVALLEQNAFIEKHLLSWLPMLKKRVDTWAELRFYPAMVRMVIGLLEENLAANREALAAMGDR